MDSNSQGTVAEDQSNVTIELPHDDMGNEVIASPTPASPNPESTIHEVKKRSGRAPAYKQFLALFIKQAVLQWRMRWTNVFIILGIILQPY
jgi:hypothetical protein